MCLVSVPIKLESPFILPTHPAQKHRNDHLEFSPTQLLSHCQHCHCHLQSVVTISSDSDTSPSIKYPQKTLVSPKVEASKVSVNDLTNLSSSPEDHKPLFSAMKLVQQKLSFQKHQPSIIDLCSPETKGHPGESDPTQSLLSNLYAQWSQHLELFAKVVYSTAGRMLKKLCMCMKHTLATVGVLLRGRLTSTGIGRRLPFTAITIIMLFQFIQLQSTQLIIIMARQSRLSVLLM